MQTWKKKITRSEAIRPNRGRAMPFLRLTKSGMIHDHTTWFRICFFSSLSWKRNINQAENLRVQIEVTILGTHFGSRTMRIDYDPERSGHHSAPTIHLCYDSNTKGVLLKNDMTGRYVHLTEKDGLFFFKIV